MKRVLETAPLHENLRGKKSECDVKWSFLFFLFYFFLENHNSNPTIYFVMKNIF